MVERKPIILMLVPEISTQKYPPIDLEKIPCPATISSMEMAEAEKKRRIGGRMRWMLIMGALVALSAAGVLTWRLTRPASSLLPASITKQVTSFTPYFYFNSIPADYTLDITHASVRDDVMFVPLTRAGSSQVVLTEQLLPSTLHRDDVQQNGNPVDNTLGTATVNNIEGRQLGTMIVGKTLILLSGSTDTSKEDLIKLLQGLKPLS